MQSIIHTATNDIKKSEAFYSKLKFEKIKAGKHSLFTDGKVAIRINESRFARPGLELFQTNWSTVINTLDASIPVKKTDNGYIICAPSGTWVYLNEEDLSIDLKTSSTSVLGNYAGLSLESLDIHKSIHFWSLLGYKKSSGNADHGWISLTNDFGFSISIMAALLCPHLFFNPSLTFFNGQKNLEVIQQIRDLEIEITEEITTFNKENIVDNIIIRDPGGYGFFIFSD